MMNLKLSFKCMFSAGLFFSCCLVTYAVAGNYKLPDTGIEKCYDSKGTVITCPAEGQPFYGQDAQYNGPKMAYHDNGDGTVTDLNTQLMWQQSDDGKMRNWQDACDYCSSLNLAGYTDWRIPTRCELFSIVDFGRSYPAVNTDYFHNCKSNWYWSGSTYANIPVYAWVVGFDNGVWTEVHGMTAGIRNQNSPLVTI